MKQNPTFKMTAYAKTEFEITRSIEACRKTNGDVEIRIAAETEGHDPVSLPCTLSADDAMRLASVLLCIEEGSNAGCLTLRNGEEVTKKIMVDCCKHCLLKDDAFDPRLKGRFVCTHTATERQIIDDINIVPNWCMLEEM